MIMTTTTALLESITVRYADVIDFDVIDTAKGSSNTRPSAGREVAIRNTLAGLPCFTCGCEVDWSRDNGQHSHDGVGTLGHVIARECWVKGGGYVAGNIGAQCRTCQYDAKRLPNKGRDLTAYVIPGTIPQDFLPTKKCGEDIRNVAPIANPTTKAERRAKRRAMWGW